jgi:hypothetical protein
MRRRYRGPGVDPQLLDTLVAAGAPGAIGAVEDDGSTIRGVSGVGNLRTGRPPRPVQTFRVASQTKVFVATAVLQLVAKGRVGLDDPVVRYLPRRLLPEMLTPVDTGAPGAGYGLGLEISTLPCRATAVGHTGALPGYNSGSFRLLGDDKDARVVANIHPAPDALYAAFFAAMVELFCGMTPAQATAAGRANPGTATEIRFR